MKILVLALLAATSINAFSQKCTDIAKEEAELARVKATPINGAATKEETDGWIKYYEKRLAHAMDDCKTPEERAAKVAAEGAAKEAAEWAAKEADARAAKAVFEARYKLLWDTDPGSLANVANRIGLETTRSMIFAKGAVQVTQLASQLQIEYSQLLMRQNDEIIRLLRIIAKEKK